MRERFLFLSSFICLSLFHLSVKLLWISHETKVKKIHLLQLMDHASLLLYHKVFEKERIKKKGERGVSILCAS